MEKKNLMIFIASWRLGAHQKDTLSSRKRRRRPAKVREGMSVHAHASGGGRGGGGGFESWQRTSEVAVGPSGQCGDVTVVARATPATPPWGGGHQVPFGCRRGATRESVPGCKSGQRARGWAWKPQQIQEVSPGGPFSTMTTTTITTTATATTIPMTTTTMTAMAAATVITPTTTITPTAVVVGPPTPIPRTRPPAGAGRCLETQTGVGAG